MSQDSFPEPLEDFLRHPPTLPVDVSGKEDLFQRTATALARPRRRLPALAVEVAAGVLLGVFLSYFFLPRGASAPQEPRQEQALHPERSPKEQAPAHSQPPPAPDNASPPPRELEWKAFDAPDDRERARLYVCAGNLYLEKNQDIESALRCYGQALAYGDSQELEVKPDDSWLLIALKNDRRKEP